MKRNNCYDIIKAICILSIIAGHAGINVYFFGYFFIVGFYFLSGITFKIKPFKEFIIGKIKRIYIPFVVVNLLAILVSYILSITTGYQFIPVNINYILNILAFNLIEPLVSPCWFLLPFFLGLILMYIVIKYINKHYQLFIISIVSLILVFILHDHFNILIYNNSAVIINTLLCLSFGLLGYIFNNKKVNKLYNKYKIDLFTVSCLVLFYLASIIHYGGDVRSAGWDNNLLFLASTVFGVIFLLNLADLLNQSKIVGQILGFIGRYSMNLMMYHLMCFNIVTVIVKCFINNNINIGYANVIYDKRYFTIFNFICGVAVPVTICYLMDLIKKEKNSLK